jgi:hypothetical protein
VRGEALGALDEVSAVSNTLRRPPDVDTLTPRRSSITLGIVHSTHRPRGVGAVRGTCPKIMTQGNNAIHSLAAPPIYLSIPTYLPK